MLPTVADFLLTPYFTLAEFPFDLTRAQISNLNCLLPASEFTTNTSA
jgi:hypothetical protein